MFVSVVLFFFKQKPAYELRISDWSSDVCSSDLLTLSIFSAASLGERRSKMPTMTQATRCFSGLPLLTKYSMRCSCVKVPGSACKDWCWQAAHDMQLNSQS